MNSTATRKRPKKPEPIRFDHSPEQLDDAGRHLVLAAYHAIHRGHVQAYATLAFAQPDDLTDKARHDAMDALFTFANLGWSAFHAMNKGLPLKDKPLAKRKAAKTAKGKGGK